MNSLADWHRCGDYRAVRRSVLALIPLTMLAGCSGLVRDRIYQPPEVADRAALPAGIEEVRVTTNDGLDLRGLVAAPRAGRPTVLVFHGNASLPDGTIAWLQPLIARGYGVVAAGYRGYDGNPGSPSEAGLARDADAFHGEARRRAGAGPLIVVGHSLGGGVGFGLARRARLDALVTIGTFTRMRDMAPRIARALVEDRYDNAATLPALDAPYFLVHGVADDVVPAEMGNRLHTIATQAGVRGGSFVIAGADHLPEGSDIAAILDAVAARLAGEPSPPLPPTVRFIPFD